MGILGFAVLYYYYCYYYYYYFQNTALAGIIWGGPQPVV